MIKIRKCVIGYYEPYYSKSVKLRDEVFSDLFDNIRRLTTFSHVVNSVVVSRYVEKSDMETIRNIVVELSNDLERSIERVKEMIKLIEYWRSMITIRNMRLPYREYLPETLAKYYMLKKVYEKANNLIFEIVNTLHKGEISATEYYNMSRLVKNLNSTIYELTLVDPMVLTRVRLLFIEKDFCSNMGG